MLSESEPEHQESPTSVILHELSLYAYRPFSDEADPRPLPEDRMAIGAVVDTFDAFVSALHDTRIEPDLEDLMWGITNVFTVPPSGSSVNSTTMRWRSAPVSVNRMARR